MKHSCGCTNKRTAPTDSAAQSLQGLQSNSALSRQWPLQGPATSASRVETHQIGNDYSTSARLLASPVAAWSVATSGGLRQADTPYGTFETQVDPKGIIVVRGRCIATSNIIIDDRGLLIVCEPESLGSTDCFVGKASGFSRIDKAGHWYQLSCETGALRLAAGRVIISGARRIPRGEGTFRDKVHIYGSDSHIFWPTNFDGTCWTTTSGGGLLCNASPDGPVCHLTINGSWYDSDFSVATGYRSRRENSIYTFLCRQENPGGVLPIPQGLVVSGWTTFVTEQEYFSDTTPIPSEFPPGTRRV